MNLDSLTKNISINESRLAIAAKKLETQSNKFEKGQDSKAELNQAKRDKNEAEYQLFTTIVTFLNSLNHYYVQTINT